MDVKQRIIQSEEDAIDLLNIALKHEWAVSFEYLFHAYSMPKGRLFYTDPILENPTDVRSRTIQIGIDEMYHALQLGVIIRQMGGTPTFETDGVTRFPRVIDNLALDKETEDKVTALYQTAKFEEGRFPKIRNMVLNISYDEVRHAMQFTAMMDAMRREGQEETLLFTSDPDAAAREDVQLLHTIMRAENELMHRYLKYAVFFSEHQDLMQRLFKNAVDHMKSWDKNAGILIKWGDVIRIENAVKDEKGVERSDNPMPDTYPGEERQDALETLIPAEEELIKNYDSLLALVPDGEIKEELKLHQGLDREHRFTQRWLLENARTIKGL
ncbi:MAG: ferritin-like domain-containing protein [Acidobacteria bacterium]|nr:ferritin-like domain-containing protein [Acidobacteriota bacterium]MBU1337916.1 ferritin-like domain-containing protein [Acidobacteriota bacterium]MBU1474963.1 ferritin-like domain-containing protein [Acidobacteriota bacterium]